MRIILGIFAALLTGTAIAVQSTLSGRVGAIIGPIRTGLAVNALGGSVALVVIAVLLLLARWGVISGPFAAAREGGGSETTLLMLLAAGLLGIIIISGVSFAVQGVGVTAGLAAVILAQLVVGLVVDAVGGGSMEAIAVDFRRIAGIIAMAVGVYLLVPRG